MHVDWTINFADLLTMLGFAASATFLILKMHSRLLVVETWIQLEGNRTERALGLLETVGRALERNTTLYESMDERVDRIDIRLLEHENYHRDRK